MAKTVNFGGGVQAQPAQPWQLDTQGLNRKQALMDALMAQNMTPTPIQTVSGRVVNNGLLDGVSKIATALMLKNGYEQADRQRADIQSQALAKQGQARDALYAGGTPSDVGAAIARAQSSRQIDPSFDPYNDGGFKTWLDVLKQNEIEKGKGPDLGPPVKDAKGNWVRFGKRGEVIPVEGYQPPPEIDIVNGVAVDKSKLPPGAVAPQDYNKPIVLGADGKPESNTALQEFEKEKARLSASNISIKMTEDQRKQTSFGIRAQPAHDQINALLEQGYKPNAKDWYTAGPAVTNWLSSPKGQQYMNAGKEFVAGVLRGDSGATITEQEWEFGKQQYIPLPGDNPSVVAQKNAARERILDGFRIGAGPGAPHIPAPGSAKTPIAKETKPPTNTGGWSYGGVQK